VVALDEPARRRINFGDLFGDRCDGFIYDDVFRRLDNFELGNSVFFDATLISVENLSAGRDGSRRLDLGATTGIFTGNDSDRRRCVFRNWRISSLA
jgi:hypothetical protein